MDRKETLSILNEVFCDIFDDEKLAITEDSTTADIEDWDSLEHINLIVACEKKFNIKFEFNEISELNSVKAIIDAIMSKK